MEINIIFFTHKVWNHVEDRIFVPATHWMRGASFSIFRPFPAVGGPLAVCVVRRRTRHHSPLRQIPRRRRGRRSLSRPPRHSQNWRFPLSPFPTRFRPVSPPPLAFAVWTCAWQFLCWWSWSEHPWPERPLASYSCSLPPCGKNCEVWTLSIQWYGHSPKIWGCWVGSEMMWAQGKGRQEI